MKRIAFAAFAMAVLLLHPTAAIIHAQTSGQYRRAHEAEIIGEFVELLSIPNVASDTTNIRRNAEKLIEMMGRRGIQSRLLEGNGPPAVFGELKSPNATRTVAIYAHYDGQPVDPSKWAGA